MSARSTHPEPEGKCGPSSARGHETIDHTADMGIRGWGRTPQEAFEEIALAMFEIMSDAAGVAATRSVPLSCRAGDLEGLLLEFLNGLLAACDLARIVPIRVAIQRFEREGGEWVMSAEASGTSLGEASDRLLTEVKAATYYGVLVRERGPGAWEARCVVDL